MKINKESILKSFSFFENTYPEFIKRIENRDKLNEMINIWVEILETVNYDYENANEDFIEAVKRVCTKNRYIPTIAEIIDEMSKINNQKSTINLVAIDTSQLTQEEYGKLVRKEVTIEELIEKGKINV